MSIVTAAGVASAAAHIGGDARRLLSEVQSRSAIDARRRCTGAASDCDASSCTWVRAPQPSCCRCSMFDAPHRGMTGWSWWAGADRRVALFRSAWPGYAPGRGSSSVGSGWDSTPPSRCCSCVRRTSRIKAASCASSSTSGSWPGFPPELPGGCSSSSIARSSSNPGSLAQYPARSIVSRPRAALMLGDIATRRQQRHTIRGYK